MKTSPVETVVVLGASANPERYSHKAVVALLEHGHHVIPVHPALSEVLGLTVVSRLDAVAGPVDIVTLYVNAAQSTPLREALIQVAPRRVIFNPGTENPELVAALEREHIECLEACTLVMLATGQF